MMQSNPQRRQFDYVDTEVLSKQNRKAFKSAAYAMGIAIGLFLVQPMLPEISEKSRQEQLIHLFDLASLSLFLYAAAITATFFFFRSNLKPILFVLNWVVLPTILFWIAGEGYGVFTK